MSVLIKDMKMPMGCYECPFEVWGKCMFIHYQAGGDELSKKCPLIEVPPHGRLIDEKQIPYVDLNADMPQSKVRVWTTFKDKIDRLPTIIEAEEG